MTVVPKSWFKLKMLKWFLALLGVALSIHIALNYYLTQKKNINRHFQLQAERFLTRIQSRLNIYETLLSQTQAFFISSQNVTHEEFGRYYKNLQNISRFYGIRGIGYSRYLTREELPHFLKEVRKEIPDFNIWPWQDKAEYFPVVYLEPSSFFNPSVTGYDQSSDKKRLAAFTKALYTGQTTISGNLHFMISKTQKEKELGFLLITPFFKNNETQDFSKKNLNGFIYASFNYPQVFSKNWDEFEDIFDYQVFEYQNHKRGDLIFEHKEFRANEYVITKHLNLFGQGFLFRFHPKVNFDSILELALTFLLIGLSITFLTLKILHDAIKRAEQSTINESYLEESLRSRDEFISIASHELKTPLTSLKLRAQISKRKLLKGSISQQGFKEFTEEIEKQVLRLERLVNDILDISRIRTDNFSIIPEEFNFCDLVKDVISRIKPQFESTLPAIIMRPCNQITVTWDRMRMEQVLNNLLTNAIKYGNGSAIKVNIEVINSEILFSVCDKGIGINPEFKESIFNRFERAGISPNEISGLGLGLYITHRIVSAHQGRIWVESQKGEGSTFYVKIPKNPHF